MTQSSFKTGRDWVSGAGAAIGTGSFTSIVEAQLWSKIEGKMLENIPSMAITKDVNNTGPSSTDRSTNYIGMEPFCWSNAKQIIIFLKTKNNPNKTNIRMTQFS